MPSRVLMSDNHVSVSSDFLGVDVGVSKIFCNIYHHMMPGFFIYTQHRGLYYHRNIVITMYGSAE